MQTEVLSPLMACLNVIVPARRLAASTCQQFAWLHTLLLLPHYFSPPVRAGRQNRNFTPNCICRGVLTVDLIVPKSALPKSVFGRAKDG